MSFFCKSLYDPAKFHLKQSAICFHKLSETDSLNKMEMSIEQMLACYTNLIIGFLIYQLVQSLILRIDTLHI